MPVNLKELRDYVFREQGLAYDIKDPVFSLVLANEFVLKHAIDSVQKHFDNQSEKMKSFELTRIELDKRLLALQNNLIVTSEALQAAHEKRAGELLAGVQQQFDAVAAEKMDAFLKGVVAASQQEVADLIKSAEATKLKLLQDVGHEAVQIVRDRVARENTTLNQASESFIKASADYTKDIADRQTDLKTAVTSFDTQLQETISERAGFGWMGQIVWMFLSAILTAGGLILALAHGILPMPTQSDLSKEQQHHLDLGASLERHFGEFPQKEQERINAVLSK